MKLTDTLMLIAIIVFASMFFWLMVANVGQTGPNCPDPVPAEWLGYCKDYDGQ